MSKPFSPRCPDVLVFLHCLSLQQSSFLFFVFFMILFFYNFKDDPSFLMIEKQKSRYISNDKKRGTPLTFLSSAYVTAMQICVPCGIVLPTEIIKQPVPIPFTILYHIFRHLSRGKIHPLAVGGFLCLVQYKRSPILSKLV